MKVKVRWTYHYSIEHTFEEVVDVPEDVIDDEDADPPYTKEERLERVHELAWLAAQSANNGDLKPVETYYPGEPQDELEASTVVDESIPARIVSHGEDEDPEVLT